MQFRYIRWSYSYECMHSLARLSPRNPAQYLWQMNLDTCRRAHWREARIFFSRSLYSHNNILFEIIYDRVTTRYLAIIRPKAYRSERTKFMRFNIKFIISCRLIFFPIPLSIFLERLVGSDTLPMIIHYLVQILWTVHTCRSTINHQRNYLSQNAEKIRRKLLNLQFGLFSRRRSE